MLLDHALKTEGIAQIETARDQQVRLTICQMRGNFMRKIVFMWIFLAISAQAATTYSEVETVRVGSKTVQRGDSAAKLREYQAPDKVIPLINDFGVKKGEEWQYSRGGGSWTILRVNNYGDVTSVLDMIDR